jgi:D-alanyl-D-alanine dipeptidase
MLSRAASPAPTFAKPPTAADIINQKSATSAPIDYLTRKAVQAVGLDKLTTRAYGIAGVLLDRFTPETIKAGMVSDYGIPEVVIDRRAIMEGSQRHQLRGTGKFHSGESPLNSSLNSSVIAC